MRSQILSRRRFFQSSLLTAGVSLRSVHSTGFQQPKRDTSSEPALMGGTPVRREHYPEWPVAGKLDEEYLIDALRQEEWCRLSGDITTRFENTWAEKLGVRHAVGVVNGTSALYAALQALDIGPGDEVIVPPYTFVATVNAVLQQFALPVFSDTDGSTFQMKTASLEERINGRTRCIMPVHLGGSMADMDGVREVARKHGLSVIEDACQAHFAEWEGRRAGGIGDIGCFSFQASKILPCGEGGAIVTNREELWDRFHAFQNNGRDRKDGTRLGYQHQGANLRLTEFQAALLLAQLDRFEEWCRHREENARYLTELLEEIPGVTPARMYSKCTRNTYYIFMFDYDSHGFSGLKLDDFLRAMRQEGIPVGKGYNPLNKEPFIEKTLDSAAFRRIYPAKRLRQYREQNVCPENDRLCGTGVFLSQRALLGTRMDTEQVAEAIRKIQKHSSQLAQRAT